VLGIDVPRGEHFVDVWWHVLTHLEAIQPRVALIAAVSFGAALGVKLWRRNWPYLLIAMLTGTLVAWAIGAVPNGVPVVGAVPATPPQPSVPSFEPATLQQLAPEALAVALLGLIEAVSIGRAIALRSSQRIDGNQEFIGQGLSNIVGVFSSCYASSGSFTRSGINYEAGARTPLSAIFSAAFLLVIVLTLAPYGRWLPSAAMGGMILLVAWNLIDRRHIREIVHASHQDTIVLAVTFSAVLFLDLAFAILGGVLLSLLLFLNRAANPSVFTLAPDPDHPKRRFTNLRRKPLTECPQLKIVRIDGPLFFGSVQPLAETLERIAEGSDGRRHLLIVASGINYLDSAGAQMLVHEAELYAQRGGGLYICALRMEARTFFERSGYAAQFGEANIFAAKGEAVGAIFERLERPICEQCTARIFEESARVPRPGRRVQPIET